MTSPPDTAPLQCSALQLAWLHELGIEKPWLPAGATSVVARARPAAEPGVDAAQGGPLPPSAAVAKPPPDSQAAAVSPVSTPAVAATRASPPVRPAERPVARIARPDAGKAAEPVTAGVPTREAAAAASDLSALGEAIAACQGCGLCASRHHVVVGAGAVQPAIMVVGEAPGEQEDRQGLPFVGRSGMLLDNMLSAIGAGRDSNVYVANAIKCRPPGNRNPRPEESAACHPFLMRQIELVDPRTILVLGRVAAQALLSTDASLQSLRGREVSVTVAGKVIPAVVSYHPAYLLRRQTEKAAAWEDLQRVRTIAGI